MKRSERTGSRPKPEPSPELVFFLDRDIDSPLFAGVLERAGIRVEPFHRHFPDEDEKADDELYPFIAGKAFLFLSRDRAQVRASAVEKRSAIMRLGVRAFYLAGRHPFPDLAQAVVEAVPDIKRILAKRPGEGLIAHVYRPTVTQPRRVRIKLTRAAWMRSLRT